MIGYEELEGYFNFEANGYRLVYTDNQDVRHAYPCQVCYSLIVTIDAASHVAWHKKEFKSERNMTPAELRQAAKRELGMIRSEH